MTVSVSNVIGGPAQFKLGGTQLSHTQGGITCNIKPSQHMVTVDKFGNTAMNVRHQGDEVKMKVPLAEYVAAALAKVYEPGNNQTAAGGAKYMGIGRSAGYLYTTATAAIVPYLTADVAKQLSFWRVTPIGEIVQEFNTDKDRLTEVEFACLGDETKTDGEIIGKLELTAS
jgi:hypothetical protein